MQFAAANRADNHHHHFSITPAIRRWLSLVPVAIISAILTQEIFFDNGALRSLPSDPVIIAGVLTVALAFIQRNIAVTTVAGVLIYAAILQLA